MFSKRLLTLLPHRPNRVAVANNCNLPTSAFTSSNWVHHCWTTHTAGPAGYTSIQVTFANWALIPNAENAGYYDFTLRAGLLLNNVFYPFTFGGVRDVTISHNYGSAISDALSVYIPPGASFTVTNRRIATDGGAAGSYTVFSSTGGCNWRPDGIIAGTDPAVDYTLGSGIAYGAKCLNPPSISGGAVTGVSVDTANMGTGYTAGPNLFAYYGPGGPGTPGALHPGTGFSGYGNPSSGHIASLTITAGGSAHNAANPPKMLIGGANLATNGFGTLSQNVYGPCMITGAPRNKTPSVLLHGDSITAGYGAVDFFGDIQGNYGFYEQAIFNRYGLHKLAVPQEQAGLWLSNNTRQLAIIDAAIRKGFRPSHVVIALGVNDFINITTGNVLAAVQTSVSQIASIWRSRGAKILMTTILPCNTTSASSNKFSTISEQTVKNANYTSGSYVDQYNAALLNNTGPKNDGVIDGSSLMRDATVRTAWRVDCFGGTTSFSDDGIHPNISVGQPYLTANLNVPSLQVI